MKKWLGIVLLGWVFAVQAAEHTAGSAAAPGAGPAVVPEREARESAIRKLEALGVPAAQAEARVNALTEEEVRQLVTQGEALPAGGEPLSYQQIGLIILIAILLALIL